MTWEELIALEPRLRQLEAEAKAYAALDRAKRRMLKRFGPLLPEDVARWCNRFCANEVWYAWGGLKDRLCRLVGWDASRPELQNSEAYDVAYEHLYDLLPNCRNCHCL